MNGNRKLKAFLTGFVSAFDISGGTFKFPDFSGGFERDREAIASDWRRVGGDLRKVMGEIDNENR